MNNRFRTRLTPGLVAGLALTLGVPSSSVFAQAQPAGAASQQSSIDDLSNRVWTTARQGHDDEVLAALKGLPEAGSKPLTDLHAAAGSLDKNIAKREQTRTEKIAEANKKLDAQLAKDTPDALSEAVKFAVELYMLSPDKGAVKTDKRVAALITRAEKAAHEAEAKGDWFTANELFYSLNALLEEEGIYKHDVRRLGLRLGMIRLYAPEQFWKLRNDERIKSEKSALPPYNGLGEDYHEKLDGINSGMVLRAVINATRQQIDRIQLRDAMLGGIDSLRTFATTTDLQKVFPNMGDAVKRDEFEKFLNGWVARMAEPGFVATQNTAVDFVEELLAINKTSIAVPDNALLHEFGNGAMAKLDEFSAIIWPDELARFNRMTEGQFRGVGIQIQLDDESQMIKIVTPLEGTPAQRAGIKAGDIIKKINGQSAVGISLNQAVDLITGPVDSAVTMTMERSTGKTNDDGKDVTEEIDFNLRRAVIPLATVKGWQRTGAKEEDWDWFIDRDNKIGYIRLLQFTEDTTTDLHHAIHTMQDQGGLNGLILDLRFNPGGLLTEAVSVANTFVERGTIVSTEGTVPGESKAATPAGNLIKDIPVVVLINEGSASASEIVSGAIRHYADKGDVNAILIGARSFGKGSVQNVWPLAANAKMKVTTQYYKLPDGRIIHRKPGASTWGVDPHLKVEMLPETESEALKLRQDADVLPIDDKGNIITDAKTPRPDPNKLISDGLDLQLQTALVLLQTKSIAQSQAQPPVADHRTPQ